MRAAAFTFALLLLVSHGAESRAAILPKADTIVLITSLDATRGVPAIWRWRFRNYNAGLEKEFRKRFENTEFKLAVRHGGDQHDLWQALRNPKNAAVFWVSHAAFAESGSAGTSDVSAIVDIGGFDVAPALQQGHPGLRFLAIIGCSSRRVLESIPGFADWSRDAKVLSFDAKTDAKKGLKQALIEGEKTLAARPPTELPCPERRGIPLLAYRRGENLRAARVLLKGVVLGVLPAASSESPQLVRLHLPEGSRIERASDLKLLLSTGDSYGGKPEPSDLGSLEVTAEWPDYRWTAFTDAEGRPIGVTQHVYRYEGALPQVLTPEVYRPFHCIDAP